ncbi:hypothetical protein BVRB_036900, partial [Beta vulgaris subsp. vulgaris]
KENPPKPSRKLLSPIRMKSPVLKEKRSYENIPFSPRSLSPILSEKSPSISEKPASKETADIIRIPSVTELETFNVPTSISERSFNLPSQSSSEEKKPKPVENDPEPLIVLPKSDDDHDVVLMGDFITSDEDKLADWHSDAEEVDFVRDALRFAKPPLMSNRSSMDDLKIVSNRSSLEKTKLDEIREQLRPVRVVKSRPFSRPRNGGDCSSRC